MLLRRILIISVAFQVLGITRLGGGGGWGVLSRTYTNCVVRFFTEEISDDDLIIDVDNSLARQLYKRWEKTVQVLNCTTIYCGDSLGTKVFIHFLLSCFRREKGFLLAKEVGYACFVFDFFPLVYVSSTCMSTKTGRLRITFPVNSKNDHVTIFPMFAARCFQFLIAKDL